MNRFSKIKSIFLKDLNWKIFSVVVAVFLWVMVINVKNPIETRKYTVPLNIKSEEFLSEEGYYITNFDEVEGSSVTITVRGERSTLDALSKLRGSISAQANLSKSVINAQEGVATCYVDVTLPISSKSGLEIVSQNIMNVVFNIEEYTSRAVKIEVVLPDDLKNSHMASSLTVEPDTVNITGPKSFVDSVRKAYVYYNSENPSFNKNRAISVYNASGKEVPNITLDISKADIVVPEMEMVDVSFTPHYSGTPGEGYGVSAVEVDNKGLEFFTYGGSLRQMIIDLPEIDIEGETHTVTEVFDITEYLPEGIGILDEAQPYVEVSVHIVNLEGNSYKVDTAAVEVEGLSDGYGIEFNEETLSVWLEGYGEELSEISSRDIVIRLVLDECVEGSFVSYAEAEIPNRDTIKGGTEISYRIFSVR